MPRIAEDRLWAGTEESLETYLEAVQAAADLKAKGTWDDDEDDDDSRLVQVQDGVAVVAINGPLNNSSGFMNRLFGMTGYPEIRQAMVQVAGDPDVKEVLLDINSSGGAVSGVLDTALLVRTVNDKIKPVTAFTSGNMASAAYFLGSSAGEVHSDRMGVVGSIGVLATHMERSKQLKDNGIGVTVVRSGKYKALANSVEPLSEEGRKQIQAQVDATDAVFVEHVAAMRNRSVDYTREHMAQGREFVGEDAQRVGLIDSITSFDSLMSLLSKKSMDRSNSLMDNRSKVGGRSMASSSSAEIGESEMKRKALTEQDIAAIAAGVSLSASTEVDDVDTKVVSEGAEADAQAETTAKAGAEEVVKTEDTATDVAASAEQVIKSDEGMKVLREQLKAASEDLLEAKIESRRHADKVTELEAVIAPMCQIVGKAINNMQVALGGAALNFEGVSASALVAEHARITEQFTSKFKAGGVAAVDAAKKNTDSKVDPLFKVRVNAV